jgi:triacylglycerol lipase
MIARILRVSLALEILFYAVVTALLGRASGWSDGQVAAALLALLLGLRLGVVAVTFAFGWIYRSPRAAEQRIGILSAVRMFVEEYLALLVLFVVIQPFERWFMGAERLRPVKPGEAPVLLVHGYCCNRGSWWWLRPQLERAGRCVATLNLEPMYGSIATYVEPLRKRIEALRTETGAERIVLVGHSMGGLACRAYLARCGAGSVSKLVTLGSPHGGSELARYGLGRNARQMEPDNAWLSALNREGSPKDLPAVSIYGFHDNFVMPQERQRLDGARNSGVGGIGHLALLFSPRLRDELVKAI